MFDNALQRNLRIWARQSLLPFFILSDAALNTLDSGEGCCTSQSKIIIQYRFYRRWFVERNQGGGKLAPEDELFYNFKKFFVSPLISSQKEIICLFPIFSFAPPNHRGNDFCSPGANWNELNDLPEVLIFGLQPFWKVII